jgi:hypothetical protein
LVKKSESFSTNVKNGLTQDGSLKYIDKNRIEAYNENMNNKNREVNKRENQATEFIDIECYQFGMFDDDMHE